MSYPKKMPHQHRKTDCQGSGSQAPIAPLICHSKDADHKLQGEEDLHGGGHAKADAWLQLKDKMSWNNLNYILTILKIFQIMNL